MHGSRHKRKPADNLHKLCIASAGAPIRRDFVRNRTKSESFMTTIEKTALIIETTALGRLDREGRLLNAVFKGPTTKPGRFGFRGDIALKFQAQVADEKRPPDFSIEQVLTVVENGKSTIPILVGYIHSFAYLDVASE